MGDGDTRAAHHVIVGTRVCVRGEGAFKGRFLGLREVFWVWVWVGRYGAGDGGPAAGGCSSGDRAWEIGVSASTTHWDNVGLQVARRVALLIMIMADSGVVDSQMKRIALA